MEQSFVYRSQKWKLLDSNLKVLLKNFENKQISRLDIIKSYQEYFNGKCKAEKPFLLTMIWGYAKSGYGYSRTKPLVEKNVLKVIASALDEIKENGVEGAFKKLKSIKGLGISFISKTLYFSSKALKRKKYQLIFDSKAAGSLLKLTFGRDVSKLFMVNRYVKFEDYKKYNELIHQIANNNSLEADAIEMFLYEQKFK
ncbi:MAG: hypothetical protein JSS63_09870 [Bacteroidetes bacterium]|nr:hypothetical protein [Bacteroidota bacterium]